MNVTLNTLRILCASYPEVIENLDPFGQISFRIKNHPFVMTDESASFISVKVRMLTQRLLLEQPGFEKTHYIGQHGWTTVPTPSEDGGADEWAFLKRLIHEGYTLAAPQRLADMVAERSYH